MKRRSFIGALVATFATPAKMLEPVRPILPLVFVTLAQYRSIYDELRHHEVLPNEDGEYLAFAHPMYRGEIGRYDGIRIIRSKPC